MAYPKSDNPPKRTALKEMKRSARTEQPLRFDGSASVMPKLRGQKDEFHALRRKASSPYWKK